MLEPGLAIELPGGVQLHFIRIHTSFYQVDLEANPDMANPPVCTPDVVFFRLLWVETIRDRLTSLLSAHRARFGNGRC